MQSDPQFPVETRVCAADVDGRATDFVVSVFADVVLVLITQTSKLASWFYACSESPSVGMAPCPDPDDDFLRASYSVDTLLGLRDEPLLQVLARQLIQRVAHRWPGKCLVLSVTLSQQKPSPSTIKAILGLLDERQLVPAQPPRRADQSSTLN